MKLSKAKLFLLFLGLVLAVGLLSACGEEELLETKEPMVSTPSVTTIKPSNPTEQFFFALLPDGTYKITAYAGLDPTVNIPAVYRNQPVTVIGRDAFFNSTVIKYVTVPEGVREIEEGAFENCRTLLTIELPSTLKVIGRSAFAGCDRIKEISLPENIQTIGEKIFLGCTSLETVTLPFLGANMEDKENAYLGYFFDNSSSNSQSDFIPDALHSIVVKGQTEIGTSAFYACSQLKSITFLGNGSSVGDSAFSSCYALEEIALPQGSISIGTGAFSNCTALTGITIPDSITSIGENAFSGCTALEGIVIPGTVESVGNGAFCGCLNLKNLVISNGVISIGSRAFSECSALESVVIPASVTSIARTAFYSSYNLKTITFVDAKNWHRSQGNYCESVDFSVPTYNKNMFGGGYYSYTNCWYYKNTTCPAYH